MDTAERNARDRAWRGAIAAGGRDGERAVAALFRE